MRRLKTHPPILPSINRDRIWRRERTLTQTHLAICLGVAETRAIFRIQSLATGVISS